MSYKKHIEPLKEKIYSEKIVHSWEYKGAGFKYNNLLDWIWSISFAVLFLLFLWSVIDELTVDTPEFWVLFFFMVMMVLVSRYLLSPDKHYCYHLTSLGIHYTEKDMIPDVAYQVVRGFAWVGIVVCIIAAFMLGPLAFVGAGGCALMSFGMTNFSPTTDKYYTLISERTVVFDLENEGVLSFAIPEKGAYAYYGDIYTMTVDQKQELLSKLHSLFPSIEFVKIKRLNDQSKHPVYHQEEEKATE
ncbi:hypothetical protein BZG72_15995 [Salinivibrio sp. PR6]|uniref:hypothetical protein n=1 Tax=Salinivibrio sp. PR6 TaxID=1909485 RepID=UPI0009896AC2|nr:hypothetical protein [Salinivibrio sp. PR6]OOE77929.1 hypothetical protein BZG72_15995 [Salinivibrio sp. PR6]